MSNISHLLKIATRSLWNNKVFTVINIAGLSVGLAAVFLISLWVFQQFRYDNFYAGQKDISKLWNRVSDGGEHYVHDITSKISAPALQRDYPEVLAAARVYWSEDKLFTYEGKHLKSNGNAVDATFLKVFEFPVISGNLSTALRNMNDIVLTESLAKRIFGNEDPVGKIVNLEKSEPYTVAAVIKDLPAYTDFDFSFLIPLPEKALETFSNNTNTFYTFVRLKEGSDAEVVNKKIEPLIRTHAPDLASTSVFLYPLSKQHLYGEFKNGIPSGGRIDDVKLVIVIGCLILAIACINFINLSTAKSQKRAKEIGIRKVIGAARSTLIRQFLVESILLTFLGGVLAFVWVFIVTSFAPSFIDLRSVVICNGSFFYQFFHCDVVDGMFGRLVSAFFLSRFEPIKVLKSLHGGVKGKQTLRQLLVVLQFGVAVFLIVSTLVVRMQIRMLQIEMLGINQSNL